MSHPTHHDQDDKALLQTLDALRESYQQASETEAPSVAARAHILAAARTHAAARAHARQRRPAWHERFAGWLLPAGLGGACAAVLAMILLVHAPTSVNGGGSYSEASIPLPNDRPLGPEMPLSEPLPPVVAPPRVSAANTECSLQRDASAPAALRAELRRLEEAGCAAAAAEVRQLLEHAAQ